jgi:hypothetical protein
MRSYPATVTRPRMRRFQVRGKVNLNGATRIVVCVAALACVSICGVIAAVAGLEMADKVNEKLPREDQFGELGWHAPKTLRLYREYKRLCPDGRLLRKIHALTAVMAACGLFSPGALGSLGGDEEARPLG